MDKYDRAIEFLVENPSLIHEAWKIPLAQKPGWELFQFVSKSGFASTVRICGCLTLIKYDMFSAETDVLTEPIRNDPRIIDIDNLMLLRGTALRDALEVFALWQRRLDREIRGIIDPEVPRVEAVNPAGNWCGTAIVDNTPVVVTSTLEAELFCEV